MILTCPSCFARYLMSADAIGAAGRTVRCGKCGHLWEQPPVRDSLDELSEIQGAAPEPAVPDKYKNVVADFAPHEDEVIPEGVKPRDEAPPPPVQKKPPQPPQPKEPSALAKMMNDKLPLITGVAVGVAAFAVLAAIVISARGPISHALPFMKPVFISMGLQAEVSEKTLVFDNVTARIQGTTLTLEGGLINVSSQPAMVPDMIVQLLDATGTVIKTLPADIAQKELKGEDVMSLNFVFENIPDEAVEARLKFGGAHAAVKDEAETVDTATTDAEDADNTHAPPEDASDPQPAHE